MYLNYPDLIEESADELARLERACRDDRIGDRIRMLRLLKSGRYRSRRGLAEVLGYSERQLGRWFDAYRSEGLETMLRCGRWGGSRLRIGEEAWQALEAKMAAGEVATLQAARQYLDEAWGVRYAGVSSISALFKRRGVKKKTGRPRHRKASAEEQAAFKK